MKQGSPLHGLSRLGLVVLLAGQLLPMIDFSIVNVALESIARSLSASPAELELIVAVYGVAFAVALAMGGRLGDNLGRRRIFMAGVAVFGVASLLCGIAQSVSLLLFARTLQGIGAALSIPQILATIHVCLSGRRHARTLGLYSAIGGLAFIIGQVLGGTLLKLDIGGYGWRSAFLVNLPFCLLILIFAPFWVPNTRSDKRKAIDFPGTVLLALALSCLLFPLALGPLWHWPLSCIATLAASFGLFPLLWWVERRQERRRQEPLLPPALFRLSSVRFGCAIALLFFSSWSGFMFIVAYVLQSGAGFSPLESGNSFIGLGTAYFIASLLSSRVTERKGNIPTLIIGSAIQMSGLLLLMATLAWVWPEPTLWTLLPATCLIGFGQAFIVSSFYRIFLSDVPLSHAGSGGALLSTVLQTAMGMGPIVLGSVLVHLLHRFQGRHDVALIASLGVEWSVMLLLVVGACWMHRRNRRSETNQSERKALAVGE